MKQRKLILLVCLTLVCTCFFSACSDPPINHTIVEDLDSYMQVNYYVEDVLKNDFKGILPAKEQIKSSNAEYYYEYECGLVGWPSFLIYLHNIYEDVTSFSKEIKRIDNLSIEQVPFGQHKVLFIVDPTAYHDVSWYMDESVYDGTVSFFEMAIVNNQTMSIEYLTAQHEDGHKRYEILDYFSETILENLNTLDYYSQDENYSELIGKILDVEYIEKSDTLAIKVELSSTNDEFYYSPSTGYYEFRLVYWSTYNFELEINDTITFMSAPIIFNDSFWTPIVSMEKDGIEYLSFNEGKVLFLSWISSQNLS